MRLYTTKDADKVKELENSLEELRIKFNLFFKKVNDSSVYRDAGLCHGQLMSERSRLLVEAKDRGFFKENARFTPTSKFQHHFSDIAKNYMYCDYEHTLRIPAIGVEGNCSWGTVEIYKEGVWAEIELINP